MTDAAIATPPADAGTPAVPVDAGAENMSRTEAQKLIAQRDALKKQIAELAPLAEAGKKAIDATKTAEERLAALTAENAALRTTAEEATTAMSTRLAAEINAIPEVMRVLVPSALSPAKQLEWIGSAHAAGLFGTKTSSPGAQIPGSAGGATITQKEFVASSESRRQAMRQQVAEGKLTVIAG